MNKKITDLPLKTTSLAAGDLFEVSEDQGAGVFISKKIEGSQLNNNVQSVTGLDTDNTDPLNPIVEISVDGSTITGSGTPASPLVANSNFVNSVTGLNTDNTDPLNPVVQIAVDGVTVTGDGTAANPLIAPEQYLWLTLEADTGSAIAAGSPIAALTIAGANGIITNTTGTTLTITGPGVSNPFTYEIGQYVVAEGGVIAHRWLSTVPNGTPTAGATQNYIVVDLNNLSVSAQWASINVDISNVESTYDGETNTINLIGAGPASGITVGTAAQLCDVSTAQGQTDWYLPSIDELSKLWQNRWEVEQGLYVGLYTQLGFNNYWSSTEYDSSTAWDFSFTSGSANLNVKGATNAVRAVRRFSI